MSVFITDLKFNGYEMRLDVQEWSRILKLLRHFQLVDADTLAKLEDRSGRVEVSRENARAIGKWLDQKFLSDVRADMVGAPKIPSYIRPIATSNGLWIDPALPILNQQRELPFYLRFAGFCHTCSGFSIG